MRRLSNLLWCALYQVSFLVSKTTKLPWQPWWSRTTCTLYCAMRIAQFGRGEHVASIYTHAQLCPLPFCTAQRFWCVSPVHLLGSPLHSIITVSLFVCKLVKVPFSLSGMNSFATGSTFCMSASNVLPSWSSFLPLANVVVLWFSSHYSFFVVFCSH